MKNKIIQALICGIFLCAITLNTLTSVPALAGMVKNCLNFKPEIIHTVATTENKEKATVYSPTKIELDVKTECNYTEYVFENTSTFKSFLSYKCFGENTTQAELQKLAITDENGLRVIEGRYCVAIGSYFNTEIGQYFDLVLKNGEVIPCIMADLKADCDTDERNITTIASNCSSEFVVYQKYLPKSVKTKGTISALKEEWDSPVIAIRVYEENILRKE